MKSYTNIEESKKLAKILPIESADMEYMFVKKDGRKVSNEPFVKNGLENPECCYIFIPCWSLATLLNTLPVSCDDGQHCLALINPNPDDKTEWLCAYEDCYDDLMFECYADNPIDACYEMILKLHELKLL